MKSGDKKDDKKEKKDILERTVQYALRIVCVYRALVKDDLGMVLGKQLLRSGTSIGANVHEAQGGQSKADFISKMSIAHKEARESAYWLRLIRESDPLPSGQLGPIADETGQLIRILSAIILTSKKKNP